MQNQTTKSNFKQRVGLNLNDFKSQSNLNPAKL